MNTTGLINAGIVAVLLTFAALVLRWQIRNLRAASATSDRIVREERDRRPGTNAAVQDELELIYGMPAYTAPDPELDAGCGRLWDAIHDEQQKGEL